MVSCRGVVLVLATTTASLNLFPSSPILLPLPLCPGDIRWFSGGKLNVSANCIDRWVDRGKADDVAIIWEADDPKLNKVR